MSKLDLLDLKPPSCVHSSALRRHLIITKLDSPVFNDWFKFRKSSNS